VHDQDLLLTEHVLLGMVCLYRGELIAARGHLEKVIARYDLEKHRAVAFRYENDPGVTALAFLSMTVGLLGYPEAALAKNREAIFLARKVGHAFSLCLALGASEAYHQVVHEQQTVEEAATEEMHLAAERQFPFWLARATILQGWARAEQGQGPEGIEQIRQGLAGWRATGARITQSYFLGLLAEAYQKSGQREAGLAAVAEALQLVNQIGEHVWEAELYRLRGELTLQSHTHGEEPNGEQDAEACFQKALGIARQQSAKILELKAATSLSRLWQRQGKKVEARALLAEIYAWFTEGFGTKDLQEAKALLAELA